ncbi:protein piccolo-like [Amphibalanus amphitrite]|uniref:protein piccolo-like n=1 Tax=Amphibalanus amphitrite TaxID=1232801 RepID=UPI001C927097|nr:protein piccolo-like [Amphibalanus amphitrite]
MDSEPGCCWRCGEPAQGMCPMCHLALYCSNTCLQDDRASHLSECDEAASTELPCAYCGRMSRELSRCARCHLAGYCSRECGELDGRRHLPACLAGRDAVLRLANRLSHDAEPFRLPVYFGDGVHALNLLRNTDQRGEEPCQVLQLSAQLPHLLRTAAEVSESRRPLLATLASDSGHQLARAYLLLYLLAREARPEAIVQVMYSLRLSAEHARLLQAALEQLVTATYTQLLQLVPWVRIGRAALSHWQEVWRAWLHAMQDAGCLARMERCRDAAMAEPETAAKLERYLGALPEGQQRSARDFLLGHGTLIGDRQRRAAADCANVTLLALNPRESRHREAFSDLRLGSNPPAWLEHAAGADTVLAPAPVPAGPLADWDRAEVQRALGADADPLEGCRMLAEDGAEAAEARAIAGQLSVRLVQFSSLSKLDELLADLRFERVFTADATDRLGLFAVLEMAEVLLAPVPHSMIVTSHSRWATLLPPAGTALSALRGSGSMHWDREMDKEKFRIQTYLQAERLAYAARARQKDVLDPQLRVPTLPEVTTFGTLLMTNFSRQLNAAVPHKFRPERRLASSGDEMIRFLEWCRDREGVRKRLASQHDWENLQAAEETAALARAGAVARGAAQSPAHRGPGLYERHVRSPAYEGDAKVTHGSMRRQAGSDRRPPAMVQSSPSPNQESTLHPTHHPSRTQSARRPRRAPPAQIVRTGSMPATRRSRSESRGFQPSRDSPLYENPAAAREAAREEERAIRLAREAELYENPAAARAAAREADRTTKEARELDPQETKVMSIEQAPLQHPQSNQARPQRRVSRRRTLEVDPASRSVQSLEPFRRSASLRLGSNHPSAGRARAPLAGGEPVPLRTGKPQANRKPAPLPRSLESNFPSLRSPQSPNGSTYPDVPTSEQDKSTPRNTPRTAQREPIYASSQSTLRSLPPHQQSSVGRSGTPQFSLGPDGRPYAMHGGQGRARSPGNDSLSSQQDSSLSASEYSALQTPEGRRRLANMFTYPPKRSERPASISSFPTMSRETAGNPPSLPVKRSTTRRETLPRQSESRHGPQQLSQPGRKNPYAALILPKEETESLASRRRSRPPDRAHTLPSRLSEPVAQLPTGQYPRSNNGAPVPPPRKKQSAETLHSSEYDDYAVPQPNPRRVEEGPFRQQSAAGSEETLVPSSTSSDKDTADGSPTGNNNTEPNQPPASPAEIDRLTQWKERKSIADWLQQDRTRQDEFDRRAQPTTKDLRWTRSQLEPLPSTSPLPTRPGRITPTSSNSTSAPSASATEQRHAFLRSRETTEEKLLRSLEKAETAWWVKRPSSTDTTTSEERSSHTGSSSSRRVPRNEQAKSPTESSARGQHEKLESQEAVLSTDELPHSEGEPQTIAELGLRDDAAAWVMDQCLQEVLVEEQETLQVQLIEWMEREIENEMLSAKKALEELKVASKKARKGRKATNDRNAVLDGPVSETRREQSGESCFAEQADKDILDTDIKAKRSSENEGTEEKRELDHLPLPRSPNTALSKQNQTRLSPFDINSQETGKLSSPQCPIVDTPAPKTIPNEFLAEMFQFKSPTTGEQLLTLRLDATAETPSSQGEVNLPKTPLFSSSVTLPSSERTLTVPGRIVINVVAEPNTTQPPAIRVPREQPMVETEVKKLQLSASPAGAPPDKHDTKTKSRPGSDGVPVADSFVAGVDPSVRAPVATSVNGKQATSDHPSVSERTNSTTSAAPQTRPASQHSRREAFKPLSLLAPNSAIRPMSAHIGHLHRSPVEEPYPVLEEDLSSRRKRLEARSAARESSTEKSCPSDSSPEQPQPPTNLQNIGTFDSAGEAPQRESSSEADENITNLTAKEQCEQGESESESGLESENTSATYRSSLHIPIDGAQEDATNPRLQEIFIKFPLVTQDTEQTQEHYDTPVNPSWNPETVASAEQISGRTLDDKGKIIHQSAQEKLEHMHLKRDDSNAAQQQQCATTTNPPTHHRIVREDDNHDDYRTPPPLPLSPPPEPHHLPAAHGIFTPVKDSHEESQVVSNCSASSECVVTEAGDLPAPGLQMVTADSAVVVLEGNAVAATTTDTSEEKADTVGVAERGPATNKDDQASSSLLVAEEKEAVAGSGVSAMDDLASGIPGSEYVPLVTGECPQPESDLQHQSIEDKQHQRFGKFIQRRRSRKLSMDKEYHDMKRKLSEANAGLSSVHATPAADSPGRSTQNLHTASEAPAGNASEYTQTQEAQIRGSTEASPSEQTGQKNVTKRPGSLASTRRKSRPLSMDAEYFAMKSQLQLHNGRAGGHATEGQPSQQSAETQRSGQPPVPAGNSANHVPMSGAIGKEGGTSQSQSKPPVADRTAARAAFRRRSGRLSMDKEFFEMRAQLALHNGGHHNNEVKMAPPGSDSEGPVSPPPSPVSGPPPAAAPPSRGTRRMSMEDEFFACRAAHLARHPELEPDTSSPPSSPKVKNRSSTEEGHTVIPKSEPNLRSALKHQSPASARTDSTIQPSSQTPTTSPKPSVVAQTIDLSPGQHSAPAARAAPDRARLRPLPLDPDILVARAREERPAVGQRALDSPTTPPSSPSSVLSRTGRPGSIRQRVRELERSAAESPRSPEQQSAPEPFSRTDRPGSVRDKVRRFEMTQRGELPAAAQQADDGEGSPVTLRRRSTHSPFTRLGSGDGGGAVTSLSVRLRPSPPPVAQRASQPPSGTPSPTPLQRGVSQRRSLPAGGLRRGSPAIPEIPARKLSHEQKTPAQVRNGAQAPGTNKSSKESPSAPNTEAPPARENRRDGPPHASPGTRHQPHAAGSSRDTTPSPPDLISWPCTTDDEVADARNAEPRATSAAGPPPRQRSASQRSGHSSPSAYETANETSFTQRESAGELGGPELAAARTGSLDGSVGTEVDPQNDDVFTDASGMPAPVTSTVTSL